MPTLAVRGWLFEKMEKRKFLFVSLSALIGDIAWQISKEGHEVRYYIEAQKERDIADGFVPKSTDWEKTSSGPTSSSSTTRSGKAPKRKLSAPRAKPSSAAPNTPTASKTIAPSARKS